MAPSHELSLHAYTDIMQQGSAKREKRRGRNLEWEIVDALYIGFLPATVLPAVAAFFAFRSSRPTPRKMLFFLGCIVWLALLCVVIWRVALLFTIDCSQFADGTEVDCGDLYRSTVVVPIIFAIPLVPLGTVLVSPWLLDKRRRCRHEANVSHGAPSNF